MQGLADDDMSRSTDPQHPAGDLPSFLSDDDTDVTAEATTSVATDDDLAHGESEWSDEHADYDGEDYEAEEHEDEQQDWDEPAAPRARTRRRARASTSPAGGFVASCLGALIAGTGLFAALAPAATDAFAAAGLDPHLVVVLGATVFALGCTQRRVGRMQQHLEGFERRCDDRDEDIRNALAELLHRDPEHMSDGQGDMQHALLSLQRQDQKINNLTKAIKMYGKPLMEIADQGTEVAGGVLQLKKVVDRHADAAQEISGRIERAVADADAGEEIAALAPRMEKLDVALAAISQRLDDSEVRKSLVRLEDAHKQLGAAVAEIQEGAATTALGERLQAGIDDAARGVREGIQQLRDDEVSGLERSVKDIQRELAGVATSLSKLQAAPRSGARASVGPAPAAAQTAPQPQHATHSDSAASEQPNSDDAQAASDASGYETGKRKSGGKNVLGAIAKLRQMKG